MATTPSNRDRTPIIVVTDPVTTSTDDADVGSFVPSKKGLTSVDRLRYGSFVSLVCRGHATRVWG